MSIYIIKGDITKRKVDAIVCTANTNLHLGGALGGKIAKNGGQQIFDELNAIGHCDVGKSVITSGCGTSAKHIIHTVGPVYNGGLSGEDKILESAYQSALEIALENDLETIEIPIISSGAYKYPVRKSLEIGLKTINEFLKENDLSVGIVIYSNETLEKVKDLISEYKIYSGLGFTEFSPNPRILGEAELIDRQIKNVLPPSKPIIPSHDELKPKLSKSFLDVLFGYIDNSGMNDTEVYKRAGFDHKEWYKIRNKRKTVNKFTVLKFAFALKLSVEETNNLLMPLGYTLVPNIELDYIFIKFMECHNYNLDVLNTVLYEHNLPLIGVSQ